MEKRYLSLGKLRVFQKSQPGTADEESAGNNVRRDVRARIRLEQNESIGHQPQATTSLYRISGNGIAKMIPEPSQGDELGSPGWTDGQLNNWPTGHLTITTCRKSLPSPKHRAWSGTVTRPTTCRASDSASLVLTRTAHTADCVNNSARCGMT